MSVKAGINKGRPSERKRFLARMAAARDGGSVIVPSDLTHPYGLDPIEGEGSEAKIAGISAGIAARLGNVLREAGSARDSLDRYREGVAGLRPWPDEEFPENVVFTCEARMQANDRVVSALVAELVEHVVIGEDLAAQAASARRRCVQELAMMPPAMAEFAGRLMACGVTGDQVRYVSRERMVRVLAALWDRTEEEASAMMSDPATAALWVVPERGSSTVGAERSSAVPEPVSREHEAAVDAILIDATEAVQTWSPGIDADVSGSTVGDSETASNGGVETTVSDAAGPDGSRDSEMVDGLGSEGGDGTRIDDPETMSEPSDDGDPVIAGSEPEASGEDDPEAGAGDVSTPAPVPSATSSTVVSVGPWDALDVSATGYVVEEWTISSDADLESRGLRVPTARSWPEMATPNTPELNVARAAEQSFDPILARQFVLRHARRTGDDLTEEEVRLWLFLVHEARAVNPSRMLGGNGSFDGVRLPPAAGSAKARRLVAIDRSDLSKAGSATALGRVAR